MSTTNPLNALLDKFKVERGDEHTHTSLAGGSYYVPVTWTKNLLTAYKAALKAGCGCHIVEKHVREYAPVLIDLDFRQDTPTRLYTHDHIKDFLAIITTYLRHLVSCIDIECYVLEKGTAPRKDKNTYKDGIHVVMPDTVTHPIIQYTVRQRFIAEHPTFFSDRMPALTNQIDDIYDKAVIEKNGWLMYGSLKPNESVPWLATKIYVYPIMATNPREESVDPLDLDLVDKLMIQRFSRSTYTDQGEALIAPQREDDMRSAITACDTEVTTMSSMANRACTAFDGIVNTAARLVDILKPSRANSYDTWIRVGWALHNIDKHHLLEKWKQFSMKSPKYTSGECDRLWQNMRDQGLSIGSLLAWAKEDNPIAYTPIYQDYLDLHILTSMSGTHTDIARVIHMMFKEKYACATIKNNKWYEFKQHRWNEVEVGYSLRQHISDDIFKLYIDESIKIQNLIKSTNDDDEQQKLIKKAKKYLNVANKLKTSGFKDSLIKESAELFYDPDFYEKLDEKSHLMGFTNGVYDLNAHIFRDGRPDDCINMTTGYDFAKEDDHDIQADILRFVRSIMPNEEMVTYLLCVCAYMLDGDKFLEELWFWTGIGRNGKGTLYCLLKKAMGQYAYEPDITIVTCTRKSSSSATPEVARAKGKRLLCATEPDDEDNQSKFKVNRLKQFRGNDIIQCRAMYKDCIEFKPQFGMIFQMNDKPELSKVDDAIARSLKVINFPYVFTSNPKAPNHKPINMTLKQKFEHDERYHQQFMRILVTYHKEYITQKQPLEEPDEVTRETQEYIESNNPVLEWLEPKHQL